MMNRILLLALCCISLSLVAEEQLEQAMDFSLPALDGDNYSLSQFQGQWVVVNYWATWCAPCRREIPELSQLHAERDDVTVLGIAYEDTDPADFETFLSEFNPSYPILLPDVYDLPAGLEIPRVLPTTFIVNPAGQKVRTYLGPVTREELEKNFTSSTAAATE